MLTVCLVQVASETDQATDLREISRVARPKPASFEDGSPGPYSITAPRLPPKVISSLQSFMRRETGMLRKVQSTMGFPAKGLWSKSSAFANEQVCCTLSRNTQLSRTVMPVRVPTGRAPWRLAPVCLNIIKWGRESLLKIRNNETSYLAHFTFVVSLFRRGLFFISDLCM